MVEYQILYWKDLPAQVKASEGRKRRSRQLPERFQSEIDRVAMTEGLAGTAAYLEQWRWGEKIERDGSLDAVLDEVVRELSDTHQFD